MTDQEQSALIKMQQETIESLNQLIKTMQKQHEDEMKRQEIIIANLNETINTLMDILVRQSRLSSID